MRRLALLTLLTIAAALPLRADRGQSYFTYDDGGTIIRQAEDNRELNARVNLPVFPGDEVITSRSGRSEVRLSDGNVIAIDRATDVRFRAILDSYEGNASQTIVELRYGHIVVQRTEVGHEFVRIDTEAGSYIATDQAIYAIESNRGADRITVFDGAVEVRTPQRTSKVRAGEEARVDAQGLVGLANQGYVSGDDFERWYLRRAERYSRASSRYLDSSLAYADADLSAYGSWTYVSSYGTWAWRPRVAVGWRPYYYGEWVYGVGGCLVWTSYEPWGWVPYHYGRWAYDPFYGWIWLPGSGYSPAWVYWAYGPGYVGWAPAGYWDCYQPYYGWGYKHYGHHGYDHYWGVDGRVHPHDMDPRPWTFLNPSNIIGQRVDRIAWSTDAVRDRLRRMGAGGNDYVTISTTPARFSRGDMKDPATAINNIVNRGYVNAGNGNSATDISSFIRRDADLSKNVRDRIVRTAPPVESARVGGGGLAPIGGGSVAPIGGGGLSPILVNGNDGRVARGGAAVGGTVNRGGVSPVAPSTTAPPAENSGVVRRGDTPSTGATTPSRGTIDRGSADRSPVDHMTTVREPSWRDGASGSGSGTGTVRRDTPSTGSGTTSNAPGASSGSRERVQRDTPTTTTPQPRQEQSGADWRSRPATGGDTSRPTEYRGSDVPRRVIDSIGGARVYPSDGGRASAPRDSSPSRVERSSPPPSSAPAHAAPSSPPPSQPAPSSPPPSSNSSSGRDAGSGRVHRNNE